MNTHLLDPEQPTTCPLCGARTNFEEIHKSILVWIAVAITNSLENSNLRIFGKVNNIQMPSR